MNIQERIEALETEFTEKIKALKAEVQQVDEFPQKGDMYWLIEETIGVCRYVWDGDDFDNKLLSVGNVFRTKEQAEFVVEKLKVEAELRKFSRPFKRDSLNFVMCFDTEEDELYSETRRFMNQGSIYFELGQAECAMNVVGIERIKKYLFGVED